VYMEKSIGMMGEILIIILESTTIDYSYPLFFDWP
jgi:hypothetical protein